jgi:hypothetical protein
VFRPHPGYYFFLHDELLAMLSESERAAYAEALARVRPSLIALDHELVALGSRFVRFVLHNYASSDGLFYWPRQDPPRERAPTMPR